MNRALRLLFFPLLPVITGMLLVACDGSDEWVHYNTKEFSIDFPHSPKDTSTYDGSVVTAKAFLETSNDPLDENAYYEVAISKADIDITQLEDSVFTKNLVAEAQLSTMLMGGSLIGPGKMIRSGNYKGAEFHINMANNVGVITMRKFATPAHIYTLKVITTNARTNNPMIGKFMNSFVIKEGAKK